MTETAVRTGYTERVTALAASTRFEDLPAQAVKDAKAITLDVLGVMLLGSSQKYASSWLTGELARQMGGVPECSVVGREFKTSCESAALVNGTIGYAADFEGGRAARGHMAAAMVPVALAMAEREQLDGRRLLAGLIVGFEIACRVSEACRTTISYARSFHPSAVFDYFGSAAVAGHILGLDQRQLAIALGIAGSNAGGLMTWVDDVTEHSRPLVIGLAARGGVTAALLARMGFGGPPAILDPAKYSIYDAYAGEQHLEALLDGLGERWWISNTTGFKRYPCCGDIHTGLDALFTILERDRVKADEIVEIEHRLKADRAPVVDANDLKSHCAQYIMGVGAVHGRIGSDDILVDRRSEDPRVAAMERKVRVVHDTAMNGWDGTAPAEVIVHTRDGQKYSERVIWARGTPQNPLTQSELEAKFLDNARTRLPGDRAELLLERINRMETLSEMEDLAGLLRCAP